MSVALDILMEIDDLQARYVRALDQKDLAGWLDTFSTEQDTSYLCVSAENNERSFPIALMYDDSRDRIDDRVTFIEKIWAGTFQDYRTRHFLQRTSASELESGLYAVETNFSILYTPGTGRSDLQVTGVYKDHIRIDQSGARFRAKRVVYDTDVLPRYIVYPF
jgi:anthranilate 1,2-dioxygenase small subunit